MICYDTFQKSSKHVCANRCQRISNPMLAYPGYNMLVLVPAVSSVSGGERSEIYHTPGTVSWFSMHFLSDTLCWCATQMPPRPIRVLSELMSVESLYVVVILSEMFQNFRRQQEVVERPKKRLGVDVKRRWLLPLSSSLFSVLALLGDLWSVFCSRSAKALVMWLCRTCQMMKRRTQTLEQCVVQYLMI